MFTYAVAGSRFFKASTITDMRLPSDPLTSTTSPCRTRLTRSGASSAESPRQAPRLDCGISGHNARICGPQRKTRSAFAAAMSPASPACRRSLSGAQFQHVAERRDPPAVAAHGCGRQDVQRRRHGSRVRVVALVDDFDVPGGGASAPALECAEAVQSGGGIARCPPPASAQSPRCGQRIHRQMTAERSDAKVNFAAENLRRHLLTIIGRCHRHQAGNRRCPPNRRK